MVDPAQYMFADDFLDLKPVIYFPHLLVVAFFLNRPYFGLLSLAKCLQADGASEVDDEEERRGRP